MSSGATTAAPARTPTQKGQLVFWILSGLWLFAAVGGLYVLWQYDNSAGEGASAPFHWPALSSLVRSSDGPTLVMLAHPKCSCTRASLGELAEALARARVRPKTYVVFLRPAMFGEGWEKTDLWRTAAALPNVTVVRDDEGREARRFGSATSGQTLLYDARGTLIFSGGVTGSRAHPGDNVGRSSLVSFLNHEPGGSAGTRVFGCPLFASSN